MRAIVVAIWPALPGLVRQFYWPTRVLELLGLAAPFEPPQAVIPHEPANPGPAAGMSDEMAATVAAYARGNMTNFVTGSLIARQDRDVAQTMLAFLRTINAAGAVNESNIGPFIAEFRKIYLSSPIRNNHGGANYTTGLVIFLIARHFNPALVVESGVLRGMSSMIFRAALPSARIVAFDLNFSLLHRSENVEYNQCDWTTVDIEAGDSALIYFDDHINQARRVVEAHRRGFRYIVLDDSWTWGAISGCGGVPLPSIDMVMSDDIAVGEKIEWVEDGVLWQYTHDAEMDALCREARCLIKAAYDIPSLYRQTGVAPTSALKFVELI